MADKQGCAAVVSLSLLLAAAVSVAAGQGPDSGVPAAAESPASFAMPDWSTAPTAAPTEAKSPAGEAKGNPCPFCRLKEGVTEAAPWLSVGGDFRFREIYGQDLTSLHATQTWHFQRLRSRLWTKITPCEDISFNFRIAYEPRYYEHPVGKGHPDVDEAIFDEVNVEWRKFLGLPMTLKVGRQEIMLGDKWLVYDGGPLDGTRSFYFEAARATWSLAPAAKTTIDTIYIDNRAHQHDWIEPFNDLHRLIAEADSQGAIVYASNRSIKDTVLEPYYIYKHDEWIQQSWVDDIHTFGFRGVHDFGGNWTVSGELARQFGHKQNRDLSSMGFNGKVTYKFKDPNDNQLYVGYEFDSGDKPGTRGRDEGFDRLWGRDFLWSYAHNGYIDTLEGPSAMSTNMHRISPGWGFSFADPCGISAVPKPYRLDLVYNILIADESYALVPGISPKAAKGSFSEHGHFRGHLPTATLTYKYNEHVSGHFVAELFTPGDFYSGARQDSALFLQYQLMIAW